MSDNLKVCCMGVLILSALAALLFGSISFAERHGNCLQRSEAVKHGAAHWEVADDGSTTFKWNQPEEPLKGVGEMLDKIDWKSHPWQEKAQ